MASYEDFFSPTPATPAAPTAAPATPTRPLTGRERLSQHLRESGTLPGWLLDVTDFFNNLTDQAMQGMTLGASEEVGAAGSATGGWAKEQLGLGPQRNLTSLISDQPQSWGERYTQALEAQRGSEAEFA